MRIKIICLLFPLVLFSCSDLNENSKVSEYSQEKSIDKRLALLNDSTDLLLASGNNSEVWSPTESDFKQIELIINKAIQNGELDFLKDPKIENINKYYRQYICFINKKGEKVVYINAFCEIIETLPEIEGEISKKPFDWKNKLLIVNDGGPCFWNVKINLSTKEYLDFSVNGIG